MSDATLSSPSVGARNGGARPGDARPDGSPRPVGAAADGSPVPTPADLAALRRYGRMLRLLDLLPDAAFDAVLRRTQRPTRPSRRIVDPSLVSRERIGRVDGEHPGVPVTWIDRPRAARAAIIHLHGGAYMAGETPQHWRWLEELRRRSGTAAAMVHYRMPPSSPFPAALDDAVTAITTLLRRADLRDETWVLSGDSAGGGLALAVLARLQELGTAPPAGLLLLSPWTDLTLSDPTIRTNLTRDVLLRPDFLERCAARYADGRSLADPRISPRFAGEVPAPPTLLLSGTDEILAGDARTLAEQLRREEVPLVHLEQPDGQHDGPLLGSGPAAQWAMRRQIAFVRRACGLTASAA